MIVTNIFYNHLLIFLLLFLDFCVWDKKVYGGVKRGYSIRNLEKLQKCCAVSTCYIVLKENYVNNSCCRTAGYSIKFWTRANKINQERLVYVAQARQYCWWCNPPDKCDILALVSPVSPVSPVQHFQLSSNKNFDTNFPCLYIKGME